MTNEILNTDLLPGIVCFGCGHENPNGLKIEIKRDPNNNRFVGIFKPTDRMLGFPGIIHGGAIYTALDCMAFWAPTILRSETKAFWILRSATIRYVRPAHEGKSIQLAAHIEQHGDQWETALVQTEARDENGKLLAEGKFEVLPLPPDKFKKVAGIDEIPKNWSDFLGVKNT